MGADKMCVYLPNFAKCMEKPKDKPIHPMQEEIDKALQEKEEKDLHDKITNYLNLHDVWFIHSRMDRRTRSTVGCPDFVFAWKGHFVGLEAKAAGRNASPEQEKAISKIINNGGFACVVRSIEEVVAILRRLT